MPKASNSPISRKRSKTKIALIVLNVLVIVGLAATSGYYYKQYRNIDKEQRLTQDQRNDKLIAEVAKVYDLPKDEKPTVFNVSDEEKFKQEYKVLTAAKKDDKLLFYEKAGIAILYRESEKKVIGTVNVAVKRQVNVQLLGSDLAVAAAEKTLTEKVGQDIVIESKGASKGIYSATVVVDATGQQAAAAGQVAQLLGGQVGSLPDGETASEGVDIVVVLAEATPVPAQ